MPKKRITAIIMDNGSIIEIISAPRGKGLRGFSFSNLYCPFWERVKPSKKTFKKTKKRITAVFMDEAGSMPELKKLKLSQKVSKAFLAGGPTPFMKKYEGSFAYCPPCPKCKKWCLLMNHFDKSHLADPQTNFHDCGKHKWKAPTGRWKAK